ncbi:MAG TPA: acyl-CoA synthetase FdrA [Lactobacillus sp.]|nr:acyl-CoA synthetase FdrA [Lactobacillus sp.]
MLYTVIRKNSYQDSINLMLLTQNISSMSSVKQVQVMMGTDANKGIFNEAGLLTDEAQAAEPNDMMIVLEADDKNVMNNVLQQIDKFLSDLSVKSDNSADSKTANNWDDAIKAVPDANLAVISVPGIYAADEIDNALDHNLNAFVFSDNVSLADEARLKQKAHKKGLLVMGPDCGTGIVSNVPLAFTNVVRSGNIGLVGASGTGIQEVTSMIERLGGGVTHAIGTGGRDLSDKVGAITMEDAISGLAHHDPTEVIGIISKPPAKEVRDDVVNLLHSIKKPVVAIFLGEKPDHHEGSVYLAHTLEETSRMLMDLSEGKKVKDNYYPEKALVDADSQLIGKNVIGLYSGGTLAYEAGMLLSEALNLGGIISDEGYVLRAKGNEVLDLGDDIYTQGRPHPMIDPRIRIKKINDYAENPTTGVILLDDVLGYGTDDTMANSLAEAVDKVSRKYPHVRFVATVVGTREDPQDYDVARKTLQKAGIIVLDSNAQAVRYALNLVGKDINEPDKKIVNYLGNVHEVPMPSEPLLDMLYTKPRVINVGVAEFLKPVVEFGGSGVQFDWKPVAGGNQKMIKIIKRVKQLQHRDAENTKIVEAYKKAAPFLVDVVPAGSVISELKGHTLLHAGPPIDYDEMTEPMQGGCIGAVLFEGWSKNEADARKLLESGDINFLCNHDVNAVGPMGGITSAHMAVLVIKNALKGNDAYCTMNEGIGKVLRFGAYNDEVINRLKWMANVLAPTLSKALKKLDGGLNVTVMMAKAITMGDEFHQRNIAATLVFLKEVAPLIVSLNIPEKDKQDVIQFLADTDQFFLSIMMATGKSIVDAARTYKHGTVVTTMTRNGKDFGIRISGLGDQWFTAPVNTPKGLFFTGFTQDDANPDIGDSAIAETVGFGGMAMIAAPGVTRFVGAGGFKDAQRISNEMAKITLDHNPNFSIPTWDYQGTAIGIDIVKVVETGITPIINTGIASKVAGVGQVGAGTVRAPLACFEKALVSYAESMGLLNGNEDVVDENDLVKE